MEKPALKVVVRVEPPKDLTRGQLDDLMDGEIAGFEAQLREQSQKRGLPGDHLITAERGLLKAYLFYAYGRKYE